ncbi:MAG: dicarboxylate/amino acid:cation symporter [Bacteriovoracaceae bacterium]|jgi:proton glutamate symport protein|nr:dicarboxylate/amino acid:cation symporter [Bacteriovoracaceae bacterium]
MSQANSNKTAMYIGIAMFLGFAIGLALHFSGNAHITAYVKPIGTMFIRALKMIIVPLVFSSIFMAILSLGTPEKLGSMGIKALGYYFITTAVAVLIGLILVNLFEPGNSVNIASLGSTELPAHLSTKLNNQQGLYGTIMGVITTAIPINPFHAMANTKILQVIVFAILFGLVALFYREDSAPFVSFTKSLESMSLTLTHWIMKLAPFGIFILMLEVVANTGFDSVKALSKYMFVVILGLSLHFVFLVLVASFKSKKSPIFIIKGIFPALMTAFSTSSSAATLPLTMSCVEDNLGVHKNTAEFVLPLGATINMDGTALYESVAVIFIAQASGIPLTMGSQVVIFLTASLAAVGAAAIPGAGLVTMSIVLTAVGLPIEGIGLILAVDRILDMFRTTVNVFGDCCGTLVVDSMVEH